MRIIRVIAAVAAAMIIVPTASVASTPSADAATRKVSATVLLNQLPVTAERNRPTYARTKFKHWTDADRDRCNTRAEVLMAESQKRVTRTSPCTVRTGSWTSRYDNKRFTRASGLDIDHVVALKEAWESGASSWSAARRQGFANDLGYGPSLMAVSATTNRSKSDRDPAQWMPRRSRCWYASHWVAVKWRWDLKVDRTEKAALKRQLASCSSRSRTVVKPSKGKSAVVARPRTPTGNDPRFGTCSEAIAAGYGPYRRGSVEYDWYRDGDKDGVVCER